MVQLDVEERKKERMNVSKVLYTELRGGGSSPL
jgi:hypothetical protein